MYTAQEIHNIAISIIDEVSDNGVVDVNKTKEYANRAPYLLDAWQKEMVESGSLYNILEEVCTLEANLKKWTKVTMATNFKTIRDLIFINTDSQFREIEYKRFGNNELYLRFDELGTARILYVPIPIKITSLTQTLEVDDIVATSGAYYLAEHYAMADQNDSLASMCRAKFKALKIDSMVKSPLSNMDIKDVYGVS